LARDRSTIRAGRWGRHADGFQTAVESLARDHGVARATGYCYIDEVIEVLAAEALELPDALTRALADGAAFVILDGKVIPAGRCREKTAGVRGEPVDLWYSGKAHRHGGNVQAVARPDGFPLWGSRPPGQDRCTTAPPAASAHCPPSAATPRSACRPWRQPAMADTAAHHRQSHKITAIARAALVLIHYEHGYIK